MKTVIISSGAINSYDYMKDVISKADYIICADGGMRHAFHMNIVPNLIIGDLDSAAIEHIQHFRSCGVQFLEYDADKDKTDTQICLEHALKLASEIILIGSLGTRIDHSIANISLLKLALDTKVPASIMDEKNTIYMTNGTLSISGKKGEYLSLIPISERVEGVCCSGVMYPLEEAEMVIGNPYGVSNRFENDTALISITKGYLLVIKSRD